MFLKQSDAEYFADDGKLNSSTLKKILLSPAHLKLETKVEGDALRFGSLFHARVFEPGRYKSEKVLVDGTNFYYQGKPTKAGAEAIKSSPGKMYIMNGEDEKIQAMYKSLTQTEVWQGFLTTKPHFETTIYFEHRGVECKSKLDSFSIEKRIILDLKTTSDSATVEDFQWAVKKKYNYDFQAAFYSLAFEKEFKLAPEKFIFAVVEKSPPYGVGFFEMTEETKAVGESKLKLAFDRYITCLNADEWPGYPDLIQFV